MTTNANGFKKLRGENGLEHVHGEISGEIEDTGRAIITLDLNDTRPLYLQIVENVLRLTGSNRLKVGDRLPSSRKLSAELGINYHTVNRAYEILIHEGILQLDRKKRITIAKGISESVIGQMDAWKNRIRAIVEEMSNAGFGRPDILLVLSSIIEEFIGVI